MLDSLRLNNFKAARDLNINLRPLTLFAGLNGSGKSSALQSLAAIRQSYQNGHSSGLQLSGPLVPLGKGSDVLNENATSDTITISISELDRVSKWICQVDPESNYLPFKEQPLEPHDCATTPKFQYLQADRIGPRTMYPQADQQAREMGFLGINGEFTTDFLSRNLNYIISRQRLFSSETVALEISSSLLEQVAQWLQVISPGVNLQAETIAGTDDVRLQYRYTGLAHGRSRSHRPTHVGFGLTYCLPIIVACLSAAPGSLLLIENPEAHLHPLGQSWMGKLLAKCASDGVQILVETHSDHVLNGIRIHVREGFKNINSEVKFLKFDEVSLSYFERDLETGDCFIQKPYLEPDGQLLEWPKGFFDQWENDLDTLLS